MITIKKDGQTLTVAKGAFDALFAPMGWTKAEEPSSPDRKNKRMHPQPEKIADLSPDFPFGGNLPSDGLELTAEEQFSTENEDILPPDEPLEDDEVEIPLSEMTISQLIEFADAHNIDIYGISGKKSIRKAIENQLKK